MAFFKKLFNRDKQEKQERLDAGMERTRKGVWSKISRAIAGKSKIDEDVLDNLEEAFITSDVGVDTTMRILDRIRQRVERDKYTSSQELDQYLCEEISALLAENSVNKETADAQDGFTVPEEGRPYVIMVVGVNGVGKTTTIGKLAWQYKQAGYKVVLGAADTFRAAAIEQLEIWAERAGADIVKHTQGSDPAAVVFDSIQAAKARGVDVVIIDTAGRLHNKANLMNELNKITRVVRRELPDADVETLMVLDATTGQNGLIQAKQFLETAGITGIVLTKLDGTAKGGIVFAISNELKLPVKYVGVGEGIDDLIPFNPHEFVEALFK